jgi:hypothetical protein
MKLDDDKDADLLYSTPPQLYSEPSSKFSSSPMLDNVCK